jgi:hypothetical protein
MNGKPPFPILKVNTWNENKQMERITKINMTSTWMANVDLFELEQNESCYYNVVSLIPPSPHLKTTKPTCHWTP